MEKSKTIEILKALANELDGRSESSRLADIIDDVENALKAGVKRQAVLNALHEHYGFKMTMSGFEKALRKLRNNKTPIPITTANTSNELVPYSNNEAKNNDLVVSISGSKYIETDLAKKEDDENDDEAGSKIDQLKFMEDLKKPPDIAGLIEIDRKKRQEERERKRKEKEQAIRKN
ncbi:MAG: hypothetical protein NTX38_05420 [Methylobacter sp.]|nr:hypothetical protein [Methylobacter sp.]